MGERGEGKDDAADPPSLATSPSPSSGASGPPPSRDLPSGLFDSGSIRQIRAAAGEPRSTGDRLSIVVEASSAQDLKAAKERRLEVVQVPALRALGLNLVLLLFIGHEVWIRHAFDASVTMTLAAVYTVYAGTSWLLLSRLYDRFPRLPLVVLSADVLVWGLAVYLSGGNESWLFSLFMVRSIDQANTTVRRVLWFSHLSTFTYIGMVVWLHGVDRKAVDFGAEVAKVLILYVPNLYFLFTVRTAQRLRDRLANTIRFAREEIGLRRTTEQALATSKRDLEHVLGEATQMAEVAMRASKAKSDFLANVSHEVRTPMNAVIGMSNLLVETRLDETQREYVATLQKSARSLLAIINDILDLSKIEAGKIELTQTDFSVREVISEVIASVEYDVRKKGLTIVGWVAPELPALLRGDAIRLRQVVLNLVSNAVKFTDTGGVAVRVSVVDVDVLPHGNAPRASVNVRFEVFDSGIGMAKDFLPRLFEPFVQAETGASRRREGTGLGLSISRELVELFGGRIWVESEPEKGSAFRFTARLGRATTEEAPADARPNPVVLTVSDDSSFDGRGVPFVDAARRIEAAIDENPGAPVVVVVDGEPFDRALSFASEIKRSAESAVAILVIAADLEGPSIRRAWCHGFTGRIRKRSAPPGTSLEISAAVAGTIGRPPSLELPVSVRPSAAPRTRTHRILLAEDNPVNQRLAVAMLTRLDEGADVVANGKEAVEAALARDYDLVLMDCQMPGMDGYEAARRIRAERATLPIVAFTAHGLADHREMSFAAGMNDHLTKPFELADLARVLERWLPGGNGGERGSLGSDATAAAASVVGGAGAGGNDDAPLPLDRRALVARLDGNETLASELVSLFFEDVTERVRELESALAVRDTKRAREIAHAIKGGAASIHAGPLSRCAAALERASASGELAESVRFAELLGVELARCREAEGGAERRHYTASG